MMKDKKRKNYAIIGGVILLILTISATYAYFMVTEGTESQTPINVTSNTTDSFTFNVSNDITITANMGNFNSTSETGKSQFDSATATATLRANNKDNEVSRNYYLYLDITKNDLIYSIDENTPELILQVKAPGASDYLTASDVATMDGTLKDLTYKSDVVDKNGNPYPGFDITGYEDLITIVDNRPIEVVEGTQNNTVTESWEVRVVFVNYNDNQTSNGGKTVNAKLKMQEQKEELPIRTMMGIENNSYKSEIWQYKQKITKVVFEDKSIKRVMDSEINGGVPFDLSKDQDGTVLAYMVKSNELISGYASTGGSIENFYPYTVYIKSSGNKLSLSDGKYLFSLFINLREIEGMTRLNTSNVTIMNHMFFYCMSLTMLDVSNFDTSNVTDMGAMFDGCESLTMLNVSNFDTSNVTDMTNMFEGCKILTTINVSNFDTSKVTDMAGMFSGCSSLTTIDVSNFDTANVYDFGGMFQKCSSLTTIDVSNFNTSELRYVNSMFSNCSSLTAIDVSNFNTSKATDMSAMFQGCSSLTTLNVSNFSTSGVRKMSFMFSGCSGLTTLNVSNFVTTSLTDMSYMFQGCKGLTTLDLSNFNTRNVTNMSGLFNQCSNLVTIYVSEFDSGTRKGWSTSSVTNSNNLFQSCSNLKGGQNTTYSSSNPTDKTYAHIDGGTSNPGYLTNINDKTT